MKKISILAVAAIAVLSMTSCKKTYHCECTVFGTTVKGSSTELNKKDAKDAEKACTANGICKWVKE